jgi:hypothetical protein
MADHLKAGYLLKDKTMSRGKIRVSCSQSPVYKFVFQIPRRKAASQRFQTSSLFTIAMAALLSCCARAPIAEIKVFSGAFDSVNAAGQPLVDELSVAERRQGQQLAIRRAKGGSSIASTHCAQTVGHWQEVGAGGIIRGFCADDASYFATIGDPPATTAVRGALAVLQRYIEILSALAEGQSATETASQAATLAQYMSDLVAFVGAAAGPIAPALDALKPVLTQIAQARTAEEARRLILAAKPVVPNLINALRSATESIGTTLIEATSADLTSEAAQNSTVAAADIARVNSYRTALSNYVVLLDRLKRVWEELVVAVETPAQKSLQSLIDQTATLKADAEAARRAFSILRTGIPAAP